MNHYGEGVLTRQQRLDRDRSRDALRDEQLIAAYLAGIGRDELAARLGWTKCKVTGRVRSILDRRQRELREDNRSLQESVVPPECDVLFHQRTSLVARQGSPQDLSVGGIDPTVFMPSFLVRCLSYVDAA